MPSAIGRSILGPAHGLRGGSVAATLDSGRVGR